MAYKKISELCMALPLVNSDLFLVSQTDVNSTNKISRQLPVSQLWSEISARFVTYDYDGAEKAALSSDRHHSFAYALSSDVSSKTQVEDRFNTLSVYREIRDQLSNDDYVTDLCVYTRISADMRFALSANVYTREYISSHYALSSDVYKQTEVFNRIESDNNYYRKPVVYTKVESDNNYYRKTDVYRKDETYSQKQADYKFTLRPATKTSLGGLKIGNGLAVASDGTVSTITLQELLDKIYPIGCIYLTLDSRNPAQIFGFGVWQRIALGKCLWGAKSDGSDLGELRESGLPDIRGSFSADNTMIGTSKEGSSKPPQGAFTGSHLGDFDMQSTSSGNGGRLHFDASSSNEIYGRSNTVQPPALVVNMWKRVATLGPAEQVFVEPETSVTRDPVKHTEIITTETAYSHSAVAKNSSWTAPNELKDLTISISLPSGCGGKGGKFYIGGALVASVQKGRTTTVTGKSATKGQTLSFNSGCRNHNLTVSVSGKQVTTTTKTVWS